MINKNGKISVQNLKEIILLFSTVRRTGTFKAKIELKEVKHIKRIGFDKTGDIGR